MAAAGVEVVTVVGAGVVVVVVVGGDVGGDVGACAFFTGSSTVIKSHAVAVIVRALVIVIVIVVGCGRANAFSTPHRVI